MLPAFARALHDVAEALPKTGKPWSEMSEVEREPFEAAALRLVRHNQGELLGAVLEDVDARSG